MGRFKIIQKVTLLVILIATISAVFYDTTKASDLNTIDQSLPQQQILPQTQNTDINLNIPNTSVIPVVPDQSILLPDTNLPANNAIINGNAASSNTRNITGEQVLDEDKEVVVAENKRAFPKWQSKRSKYVKDYDYYIKVNKRTNTVTVYIKEENGDLTPYKSMVCSVGREGHDTPEGTGYKTTDYYDWRLMVDNTYGRYAVRFNGSIMFHSVPYYESKKDSLEWQDYNKLGGPASLGCIRLAVADAKWIFDNCKRGTEVDVYSGPASTDPLGTPEPIRLDTKSEYRDWDPTDITPENPWVVPVE